MEEDLALFRYTRQKMDEQPERELSDAVRMIFDMERIDSVAERLAEEAYPLWRYDPSGDPFDADQWRKTMKDVWLRKGSFPALYQETGIYDKREVAACFLLTAKLSLEEGDKLLDALATNNQSYESRRLYPLHFKEGFFRLAIGWDHLHGTMCFPQAVDAYLAYESTLLEKLKGQWDMLRKTYAAIGPEQKESGFYKTADYYHRLCESLWMEAAAWQSPLSLRQQDELQRWVVLLAHEERSLQEAEAKQDATIAARNRDTRRSGERGTKLCENLIRKCCEKDTWKGAVEGYLEGSLPAIGEACWRAASKLMRAYSESGRYDCPEQFHLRLSTG